MVRNCVFDAHFYRAIAVLDLRFLRDMLIAAASTVTELAFGGTRTGAQWLKARCLLASGEDHLYAWEGRQLLLLDLIFES